jgi:D-xylose transport system substrate-binding protein
MNKWLRIFVGIMVMASVFSCGKQETFTVGYLNPSADRHRFVTEGNYMAEKLQELGHEVIIMSGEDNDAIQLAQGYEMLELGVDALVIAPVNGNTIAPLVRDAQSMGVKVIGYNRLINNADFDLFVTGDNEDNARLFCQAALQNKPTGNYVVFAGDRFDKNGFELKLHIDSLLKPHIESGRINLLYESYIEGWNLERAEFEMQQVVDTYGTDIDAIIACNDPMGLGALAVMKKYDAHGGVIVTGQDATLEAVQSIYKGEMYMTIYHPHRVLGYKTGELVDALLRGESSGSLATAATFNGTSDIHTVNIPSIMVTRENLEEILIQSGEYAWEDIR